MPEIASTEAPVAELRELPSVQSAELPHIRIEPKRGWVSVDLKDLWEYRELLFFLADQHDVGIKKPSCLARQEGRLRGMADGRPCRIKQLLAHLAG